MIVEFLGPTSSGKSTLVKALQSRLRAGGIDVATAEEVSVGRLERLCVDRRVTRAVAVQVLTLPWLATGIARWPATSGTLLRLIAQHGETLPYRLHCLRNALLHIALESRVRSASRRDRVLLLDEGLVSFVDLLAGSLRSPDPAAVRAYAQALPLPDLVVHVTTRPEMRVPRMVQRGHRRLRSRDHSVIEAYARHGDEAARLLAAVPRVAARLMAVDAGDDSDSLSAAVEAVRDAILAQHGRGEDHRARGHA